LNNTTTLTENWHAFDETLDVVHDVVDGVVGDAGRPGGFVVPAKVGSHTPDILKFKMSNQQNATL
jgi:hypothetical protein